MTELTKEYRHCRAVLWPLLGCNETVTRLVLAMRFWTNSDVSKLFRRFSWPFLQQSIYFWQDEEPEKLMDQWYLQSPAQFKLTKRPQNSLPARARCCYYNFLAKKLNGEELPTKTEMLSILLPSEILPAELVSLVCDYLFILV